jgi:hypothetical protein
MSRDHGKKAVQKNAPDARPLSEEDLAEILETALYRMVMIDGMVYGLEDDTEPEGFVNCAARIASCRADCCTYASALTQEEVNRGFFKYSAEQPFYMARDADKYCHYLDRKTFQFNAASTKDGRCAAENMHTLREAYDK